MAGRSKSGDRDDGVTVSFGAKFARSEQFKAVFREGMALVEAAATYLDGDGRKEARKLRPPHSLAYATESMRLTTRLMQLASWLLIRRAVSEGELTPEQAIEEQRKVALPALGAIAAGFVIERRELIGAYETRLIEQPADQGRLAVVDGAADDEPQQALAFLARHECVGIEQRRVLDAHQKYPSCFLRSMAALPSWSMRRPRRSENWLSAVSRMIPASVVALLSIAPVSG